ncbi:MAG: hypothetical protein U0667_04735 [Chloroflexota bacterium]
MPAGTDAPTVAADQLPNLPLGQHLGFKSFAELDEARTTLVERRVDEATAAGVDIARLFYDWNEVEPRLGQYQFEGLRGELGAAQARGQVVLVGLLVGGGEELPAVPQEFLDTDPGGLGLDGFRDGLRFDSTEVADAYLAMLDRIMPELLTAGIWGLTVSNEPDNGFELMTDERAQKEADSLAGLLQAVSAHIQSIAPGVAVHFTMSSFSIREPHPALDVMIDASDIVSSNFLCLDGQSFTVADPSTIGPMLDRLVALADGRQVVIQELSCASGPIDGTSVTKSSTALQDAWLGAFYRAMEERPAVRAAFVLDLVDWPAPMAVLYADFLRQEGLDEVADKYQELLGTWGLLTYDIEPKPSWDGFLHAARQFANRRQP